MGRIVPPKESAKPYLPSGIVEPATTLNFKPVGFVVSLRRQFHKPRLNVSHDVRNGASPAGPLSRLNYCKAVIPLPGTGLPSPDDWKGWVSAVRQLHAASELIPTLGARAVQRL
jgi:hypothetical protein